MNADEVLAQLLEPARRLDEEYASQEAELVERLRAVKAERPMLAQMLRREFLYGTQKR